jgi:hypothetical protein
MNVQSFFTKQHTCIWFFPSLDRAATNIDLLNAIMQFLCKSGNTGWKTCRHYIYYLEPIFLVVR